MTRDDVKESHDVGVLFVLILLSHVFVYHVSVAELAFVIVESGCVTLGC